MRISRTGDVACERPADECVGVAVTHAMLGLQIAHDVHMLSRPQPAMICCHSAIERAYFLSILARAQLMSHRSTAEGIVRSAGKYAEANLGQAVGKDPAVFTSQRGEGMRWNGGNGC